MSIDKNQLEGLKSLFGNNNDIETYEIKCKNKDNRVLYKRIVKGTEKQLNEFINQKIIDHTWNFDENSQTYYKLQFGKMIYFLDIDVLEIEELD